MLSRCSEQRSDRLLDLLKAQGSIVMLTAGGRGAKANRLAGQGTQLLPRFLQTHHPQKINRRVHRALPRECRQTYPALRAGRLLLINVKSDIHATQIPGGFQPRGMEVGSVCGRLAEMKEHHVEQDGVGRSL